MNHISRREAQVIADLIGTPEPAAFVGGVHEAAARFDRQIARWTPPLQSANMDILPDKLVVDARTRDLGRNDAYVRGAAQTHKDSIVGAFYMLNSKPAWKVLGRDQEWAEAFQQEVEEKFTLWAESPQKWVDAARENDFTSMIRLLVGVYVFTGEVLATVEWPKQKDREFNTAIQLIDSDRLSTPPSQMHRKNIIGGIKRDTYGAAMSYYIRTTHPADWRWGTGGEAGIPNWKEVPTKKPWGRLQVIYLREQNRIDQSRGMSDMVAGLREMAITRKFRDVTLQRAVLAATYAATIESEYPPEIVYQQLGAVPGTDSVDVFADAAEGYLAAINDYIGASKHMMIDGVKVPHLFPGTSFKMQSAGEQAGVGQDFEASLLRYMARALNVSYEELSGDFQKSSYSAARAALLTSGKFMASRKRAVADAFANAVFRLWLEEAIQKDMLTTFRAGEADMLYTNGCQNMMFDALCQCDWIGAGRGQLDELKETQASVLKIKYGLSTHEDELARLGKDWRKVYAQLEREKEERDARGIELQDDNSVNAASGSPRESEDDGTDGGNERNAD